MQKVGNSIYRGWIVFYCGCGKKEYSYQNLDAVKICECGTKQADLHTLDIDEWDGDDFAAILIRDLENEQFGNHVAYIKDVCENLRRSFTSEGTYNTAVKTIVEAAYGLIENLRHNVHG